MAKPNARKMIILQRLGFYNNVLKIINSLGSGNWAFDC